jgi:hypothetical protein
MAGQIVNELRTTMDAVWARLSAQLHGIVETGGVLDATGFRGIAGQEGPPRGTDQPDDGRLDSL